MSKKGFRSSLQVALSNIGRRNGHAPPSGGSNLDPAMHYYMVDSEAKSFFEAQRKQSHADLIAVLPTDAEERLAAVVKDAKEQMRKQPTVALLDTSRYVLNLDVKKPSERVDTTALRNKLMRDGRYTAAEVDQLFEKCTKESEPAKTFTVSPLFD